MFGLIVYGDAGQSIEDHARGGDDTIIAGGRVFSVYGDSYSMLGHARGGDDTVSASAGTSSGTVYGEAYSMTGHARGGNDVLSGSGTYMTIFGDAYSFGERAKGGNDSIVISVGLIGAASGDATEMSGASRGGNDTLVSQSGSGATVYLSGDASVMSGRARGGNDVLVSGAGTEHMWGDAQQVSGKAKGGHDTFVFGGEFGNDLVGDFRPREGDRLKIDVANPHVHGTEVTWQTVGSDTVITVAGNTSHGTITLVGYTGPLDHGLLLV